MRLNIGCAVVVCESEFKLNFAPLYIKFFSHSVHRKIGSVIQQKRIPNERERDRDKEKNKRTEDENKGKKENEMRKNKNKKKTQKKHRVLIAGKSDGAFHSIQRSRSICHFH